MHSELFTIGPFSIHTYGLCMAIGFLLAWQLIIRLGKRTGQKLPDMTSLLTWVMLCAIAGARTAYVCEHWTSEFAGHPLAILRLDQGGLMFYGGLIAAFIPLILCTVVRHIPFFAVGDLIATALPLGHAFGRLGCFMHGCCYGRESHAWCAVAFPPGSPAWSEQLHAGEITAAAPASIPVLPTQLLESIGLLAIFFFLFAFYPRAWRRRGLVSGTYLILYAILRFNLEYLRGDPRMQVGPFSISQTISLGMALLGIAMLAFALRNRPAE